jgi:hypothetical protein
MGTLPPGGYPPSPQPKKSNVLLWILVGVFGLFMIGAIAIVGGGLFIAHKVKDFAEVRDGKVTLKKDGKDVVISSGKGSDGTVEIKSADGTVKFGAGSDAKFPSWVPVYPGSTQQGVYSAQTKEGASGSVAFKTSDSVSKVADFYQQQFKAAGMQVTNSIQAGDSSMLSAQDEGKNRTATVIIGTGDGQTTASVTYVQK